MNKEEARRLLDQEIAILRGLSYEQLRSRMPQVRRRVLFINLVDEAQAETHEVTAESGTVYQVETQVFWDGRPDADLRVLVAIDDGGLSAFKPMTDDFIIAPDGTFVDE